MPKLPVKWEGPNTPKRYDPNESGLTRPGAKEPGTSTITRIVEILIQATSEGKIHWFRDAPYFAVTYFPMLAASFRLQIVGGGVSHDMGGVFADGSGGLDATRAKHLSIAFIDNKEFRCLGSQYPLLHELSALVWSTFSDDYQRDRNERLEWLEKALRMFLPHVVSSSVDE